jgi:RNA methyltransferase, TrmH family
MSEIIRSLQNPRIKQAVQLRNARKRRELGLMVIDGEREIQQAIRAGIEIKEVFALEAQHSSDVERETGTDRWHDDDVTSDRTVIDPLDRSSFLNSLNQLNVTFVSGAVMERLAYGERNVLYVAIAKQPALLLNHLKLRQHSSNSARQSEQGLILVIDRVEKPGNLGAMLRTADAIGVSAVLLSDPICEIWNPNAIRSSLGAIFHVPIAVASSEATIAWLREQDFQILAARLQASENYRNVTLRNKVAIAVGSEAEGLGSNWIQDAIEGIRLPMQGSVDSLNVSVSAAVLLYDSAARLDWFSA